MEDYRFYAKHKVFSHVTALAGSGMLDKRAKVPFPLCVCLILHTSLLFEFCVDI